MADKINVLIPEETVDAKIKEIGEQISKDYAGKEVHLICILKGGVFFACELAKRITVPVSLDFMQVSSYGNATESSGIVRIKKDLDDTMENKEVIIVEDIIDSGRTLHYLIPASLPTFSFPTEGWHQIAISAKGKLHIAELQQLLTEVSSIPLDFLPEAPSERFGHSHGRIDMTARAAARNNDSFHILFSFPASADASPPA